MNEKASPQASEQQEQQKAERTRLANAFFEVFGTPGRRTTAQTLVIAHLEKDAPEESNAFDFRSSGNDGFAIALAAAHKDGAQSRIRIINRQVRSSLETIEPKRQPKKVIRHNEPN